MSTRLVESGKSGQAGPGNGHPEQLPLMAVHASLIELRASVDAIQDIVALIRQCVERLERLPTANTRASAAEELLTDEDIARILRLSSVRMIHEYRARGLPYIKITSKIIRYRRKDIEEWLAQKRRVRRE